MGVLQNWAKRVATFTQGRHFCLASRISPNTNTHNFSHCSYIEEMVSIGILSYDNPQLAHSPAVSIICLGGILAIINHFTGRTGATEPICWQTNIRSHANKHLIIFLILCLLHAPREQLIVSSCEETNNQRVKKHPHSRSQGSMCFCVCGQWPAWTLSMSNVWFHAHTGPVSCLWKTGLLVRDDVFCMQYVPRGILRRWALSGRHVLIDVTSEDGEEEIALLEKTAFYSKHSEHFQ